MSDSSPPQQLRKRHKSGPSLSSPFTSPSQISPSGSEPSSSGTPHQLIQPQPTTPPSPTSIPSSPSDTMSTSSGSDQELPQHIMDYYMSNMGVMQNFGQEDIFTAYFHNPSYVFIEHLGSGSFGEVYKACHPQHLDLEENIDRPEVSIKIFTEKGVDDKDQFEKESMFE